MRLGFLFVMVSLCLGCSGKRPATPSNAGVRHVPPAGAIIGRTNATAVTVTPAPGTVYGKVAHVNASDRFVVLTYPIGRVPPNNKRLSVYRDGMKVGELKVTGPREDPNTVADITAGEARAGDEVRDF
jgi:hypothetical protein